MDTPFECLSVEKAIMEHYMEYGIFLWVKYFYLTIILYVDAFANGTFCVCELIRSYSHFEKFRKKTTLRISSHARHILCQVIVSSFITPMAAEYIYSTIKH